MMPLLGHVGLALATSLSGLASGGMMVVLLRRLSRLGGGCISMMGRIFLATMMMSIFLILLANFGSGLKHFVPAALWLAVQVIFGAAAFFAAAFFFKAIPAGLAYRWRHRNT